MNYFQGTRDVVIFLLRAGFVLPENWRDTAFSCTAHCCYGGNGANGEFVSTVAFVNSVGTYTENRMKVGAEGRNVTRLWIRTDHPLMPETGDLAILCYNDAKVLNRVREMDGNSMPAAVSLYDALALLENYNVIREAVDRPVQTKPKVRKTTRVHFTV